jgi:hypothetical protein
MRAGWAAGSENGDWRAIIMAVLADGVFIVWPSIPIVRRRRVILCKRANASFPLSAISRAIA